MQFTVPAICGGDDYFRTNNTGYCSLLVLAMLHYLQKHPDQTASLPDCSTLSEATLQFARAQLEPLRVLIESDDSPVSKGTQSLWALLQGDHPPPLLDDDAQECWMYDTDFLVLAAQLKLSFSLWQEPYEGIGHNIPLARHICPISTGKENTVTLAQHPLPTYSLPPSPGPSLWDQW
jgi:hypothetical protein